MHPPIACDIHETYSEIENFKWPDAIHKYGHPFTLDKGTTSTSPVLQTLLSKFVLELPGLRDVSDAFWQERCQTIIEKLGAAELSESYDKGALGLRKSLATAISALIEYPARGCLGGFPRRDIQSGRRYDTSKPEDVVQAWDDFLQQLVYGDLINVLFKKAAETDNLKEHPSLVQAAHEFVIVKTVENVHKLVPYTLIRQTLRVGNAATMINGMVKLMLAKVSVGTFTNWMGISQGADEGMNLMQQIISTVMGWDIKEFQKRALKLEKSKDSPGKEYLDSIKAHVKLSRDEHEKRRKFSQKEEKSIVAVIFESASLDTSSVSEAQYAKALEYLTVHLSIRDREELTKIFCKMQPDLLTQAVRDLVAAYDPIIRDVHNAVDLSATLTDLESFLNDLIKLSRPPSVRKEKKPKSGSAPSSATTSGDESSSESKAKTMPSVEEYVRLLKKHQGATHRFLHQVCKNGPQIAQWFRDYAHHAASQFRPSTQGNNDKRKAGFGGAGTMTPSLESIFSDLPESTCKDVLPKLDSHGEYLKSLSDASAARMKAILSNSKNTSYGPGIYLAKWQELLNATPITPLAAKGPVRSGTSKDVREAGAIDGKEPEAPDVSDVVKLLGPKFREMLASRLDV
ncbi:hypothetical protein H2199_007453 [Coniosporium tulheliwenetii]|uniref:Uncharacterized protein n=1 Tax=Coniosporium tulheliwenetii TaxID=3383036 RepID=A0ACC2YP67_9PEZI|nr:hypothetical protein H2199_007453 [Cladosporium sp. JES 115]